MISKEQQEIVDFTRNAFNAYSKQEQDEMYLALCICACMKWPGETNNFIKTYLMEDEDRHVCFRRLVDIEGTL